ncbi:thiamine biosynthesis protein ThiI [Clostridium acetobutylicum]|uniref:Probable tRNA sulfurtransferase n=1 Tax=Clostridium acetobutylicum (strain ATCC 824 / DSM 792 / JCM 1419 / IAM 19013 / LMG 5710 / NBRC 13948 / NRRL B-527 / VKM B-1787 / 2291 / W) TaxID=272562 RepID=THII_CLOAB|nr:MULTISPECIES: tRNA uracil 4-sulfurtransferase ThiI [Clostridium]Q97EY4.1 RecName: Full=Probable tRNA sulfurtransferase; AltName: Full=Sulfur carrier protein ThiS sulfurtransferase; AltName: Full=Thiamine biosynthesis protein ThiI; AltName: Full=tRNA 4-thiouridine synthase [Clostridium acetobutylicum ATCC 824]AAK80913.1 Thiamine biosynthesis enzyme, THII [Clostridium acetobutylicum ATCC 824]ADZ22015.1 Thiamine biosynthesis enzyme, THII [Clostridium acetobutylicum EA 2018]AEI34198.1 thiamine b
MNKLLMVKYASEIFLKGLNKNKFEKILKHNIATALNGVKFDFVFDSGRWFIKGEDLEEVVDRVRNVFGVAEVCIVTEIENDFDTIKNQALLAVKESGKGTFKVETNRANKGFPLNSMDINREVGAYILKNNDEVKVDIHNPECLVNIEIRKKTYIYSKRIKGVNGMPYKTNGQTLLMLSGGIDSPVAGYMMARRGVEVSGVYFHSAPYTSERAKDKVKDLARILTKYIGEMTLYVVPFTDIQMQIIEKCREDELTIIMRRFMMSIACKIAEDKGMESVATGESIGQVASQTMQGLVVSNDCADRPVFRPLISMDKIDIMDISRKIGTYETSILPYEDCCTIFVPKHPKTKPILGQIRKAESVLDKEKLINDAVEKMEVIQIKND